MRKVKITVIRKEFYPELADPYLTDGREVDACPLLNVGDSFIYEGSAVMPEGFCPWAWIDVYRSVSCLSAGGSCAPWHNNPGQTIVCCTDGVRPVVFSLETYGEHDEAIEQEKNKAAPIRARRITSPSPVQYDASLTRKLPESSNR